MASELFFLKYTYIYISSVNDRYCNSIKRVYFRQPYHSGSDTAVPLFQSGPLLSDVYFAFYSEVFRFREQDINYYYIPHCI